MRIQRLQSTVHICKICLLNHLIHLFTGSAGIDGEAGRDGPKGKRGMIETISIVKTFTKFDLFHWICSWIIRKTVRNYSATIFRVLRHYYKYFTTYAGMIIEIGERIAPERGDKGDFGYPGMNTHTLTSSKIPLILIWVNRPKIDD